MHMVSKINRLVALAVLHAHVSTQLCCDWVSRVVSDWIVESKLNLARVGYCATNIWNGRMMERNGGIAECTEYSKIRNIWNILKHGKNRIFWNTEYTENSKTRNMRNILKRGMRGKSFKDGAYYCYCAHVLRISRYSDFLWVALITKRIFWRGSKLRGVSRT